MAISSLHTSEDSLIKKGCLVLRKVFHTLSLFKWIWSENWEVGLDFREAEAPAQVAV